jgi:hypothetical protein
VSNDALAPFVAAIAGPIIERLDRLQAKVDALEALVAKPAPYRPLAEIDGITAANARGRLARDPGLRALGIPVGTGSRQRLVFDAEQVRRYRAAKVGK